MSQITSEPLPSNVEQGESARASVKPSPQPRFVAPKPPIWNRVNYRLIILAGVVFLFVGAPFFIWARDALSGGIIRHGDYADVNLKAMSSFDMDQMNGSPEDIPAKFRGLEGTRVHLVGEMWAPNEAGDGTLKYFQLVYSKTKCCFSGPPLAQHFVDSNVVPGRAVYYDSQDMMSVWGTLHIKFRRDPDSNVIKSVYEVDVDKCDPL